MQYDGGELAFQIVTSTVDNITELVRLILEIQSVCLEDKLSHTFIPDQSFSIYGSAEVPSW